MSRELAAQLVDKCGIPVEMLPDASNAGFGTDSAAVRSCLRTPTIVAMSDRAQGICHFWYYLHSPNEKALELKVIYKQHPRVGVAAQLVSYATCGSDQIQGRLHWQRREPEGPPTPAQLWNLLHGPPSPRPSVAPAHGRVTGEPGKPRWKVETKLGSVALHQERWQQLCRVLPRLGAEEENIKHALLVPESWRGDPIPRFGGGEGYWFYKTLEREELLVVVGRSSSERKLAMDAVAFLPAGNAPVTLTDRRGVTVTIGRGNLRDHMAKHKELAVAFPSLQRSVVRPGSIRRDSTPSHPNQFALYFPRGLQESLFGPVNAHGWMCVVVEYESGKGKIIGKFQTAYLDEFEIGTGTRGAQKFREAQVEMERWDLLEE